MNARAMLFNNTWAALLRRNPLLLCQENPRHNIDICFFKAGLWPFLPAHHFAYQSLAKCPTDEGKNRPNSYYSEATDEHHQGFWQNPHFESQFQGKSTIDSDALLGSGTGGQQLDANPCGRMRFSQEDTCKRPAVIMCRSCSLVSYCGSKCQHNDWELHQAFCHSGPMNKDWKPASAFQLHLQQELPELPKSCNFSWGNVPAYSILQSSSVDVKLPKHLRLCFAASGDLRNIIETVCELPHKSEEKVTIYINDRNPKIAARNFLLLELLKESGHNAIDAVIGAWYSCFLTKQQSSFINRVATSAASRHCCNDLFDMDTVLTSGKTAYRAFASNISKPGSRSSLITHFNEEVWETISAMCRIPQTSCDLFEVHKERHLVGSKFAQRKLHRLRPAHRLGWMEFQKWGMVLPFGASRAAFNQPNPFLFQAGQWLPDEEDDPLNGWNPLKLIPAGLSHGISSMDLYGCLFFYLREKLALFLNRLHSGNISLRLFCEDASQLAKQFKASNTYLHLVDTSNISDSNYLGLKNVLLDWGPILDRSSIYRATLITFLMNWAYETPVTQEQHATSSKMTWTDVEAAISCIAKKGLEAKDILRLFMEGNEAGDVSMLNYFHDFDKFFSEYLDSRFAGKVAAEAGLQRRKKHCVVPHRFFVDMCAAPTVYPGMRATFEECYNHTVVGELNMTERFVEWEVTDQ